MQGDGIEFPRTKVTDDCELSSECWESNLSLLKSSQHEVISLITKISNFDLMVFYSV